MPTAILTIQLRNYRPAVWVLICWMCIQAALIPNTPGSSHPANIALSGDFSADQVEARPEMSGKAKVKAEAPIRSSLARLPLRFEANLGQAEERFSFISRAGGYGLLLGNAEATLVLNHLQRSDLGLPDKKSDGSSAVPERPQSQVRNINQSVLRMKLIGANASARILGLEPLPVKSNYFIGSDPRKWQSKVPSYARVRYEEVYPGIDLVFYGNQGHLEYDFIVAPGATPEGILLKFEGADRISVGAAGDLVLETPAGRITQHNPTVYQEIDGTRQKIDCHYAIERNRGNGEVQFKVGSFDAARPLVIDPILSYSTFLGGENQDLGNDVAVDSAGNVYIVGVTWSVDFPVASALYPTRRGTGFSDVFVAKLDPSGTELIYSTFLGGNDADEAIGIAVDSSGNAYIIGSSASADFPITPGSFQPAKSPPAYASFVTKISAEGEALSYSTFFGGIGTTNDIAVDQMGNAYVTGTTTLAGGDFPTTPGAFQRTPRGSGDAIVAKLNPSGSTLIYSTYLGGRDSEFSESICLDAAGNAYVTGYTLSSDFPTTSGAFQSRPPPKSKNLISVDAFVAKLNATGSGLVYSTFLAGNRLDRGLGIGVDAAGNAYVTGETNSLDFPTTAETLQTEFAGGLVKSNNGGEKWKGGNTGLKSPDVAALAVDPRTPTTVYAATETGIFKSTDKGSRWVSLDQTEFQPSVLAVDPVNPLVLYAGAFKGPIHKSTDAGLTWFAASDGLAANFRVTSLIVDGKNPSKLYAGGVGPPASAQTLAGQLEGETPIPPPLNLRVLFISTDAGRTWAESPSIGLPRNPVIDLTQDSTTNSIYLSSGGPLHKSNDGGVTWQSLNIDRVSRVAVDPKNPATLYAVTPNGISRTLDGGQSWTPMNTGLPPDTFVTALVIDPENPATIFAGTPDGVFRSTDGALSWIATPVGGEIRTLALDPLDPETVYAVIRDPSDAFLTKLSPTGGSVQYSTFLGGQGWDTGFGIAVSPAGSAYVTGQTFSSNFPTLAAEQTNKGITAYAGFVTKVHTSGDALAYSTYLGGNQPPRARGTAANAIALGASGAVYVVGDTYSPDFPTVNALQPAFGGGNSDCFLARFVELRIDRVSVQGKDLIVSGEFFDPNAVVLLDGKVRKTTPDVSSPTKTLIATKAGKKIKPGKTVTIQIRNSNGELSEPFLFTRAALGLPVAGFESRYPELRDCMPAFPSPRSEGSKPAIGNPGLHRC